MKWLRGKQGNGSRKRGRESEREREEKEITVMLKLCGHQSPRRTHTLCTILNYLSSFIRWHMAKQCQRLRVEIQGRGPQNKWLLFFERPPLAEYLEYTKRARGAISGGIINLNQPSHNTSPSVTLDNEFSGDAYKLVLFSATSEVFCICA